MRKLGVIVLVFLCGYGMSYATPTGNAWDVLRQQFRLNHDVTQPEVQQQLHWLTAHPSYLHKLAQSEPYLYHILTEVKKRNLPGEIVLIPMIESAYDPFAYSGVGAAGLWQLMPGTGTDLGLKQDWWADARRSIRPSTDAALSYLLYLNRFFHGNWILAFAAYDYGEGNMARIIKQSQQRGQSVNFWTLAVPRETKAYVPRLLALAEIIQHPDRYHVQLPPIPWVPYFEEVNIGSQIDLNHAAKLAGITYQTLLKLNPGYNHWATAPYRPYKLLIPADRVQTFSRNLANLPEDQRVSWTRHQVSAGDNLTIIAQRYHTTVNLIKELNQLKSNAVKKGAIVLIPTTRNTVVAEKTMPTPPVEKKTVAILQPQHYKRLHIVQKNDSYRSLEKQYGITRQALASWNNLSPTQPLHLGQRLVVWRTMQSKAIAVTHAPMPLLQKHFRHVYIVRAGDSLSKIAQQNHVSLPTLYAWNPGMDQRRLKIGQSIRLG